MGHAYRNLGGCNAAEAFVHQLTVLCSDLPKVILALSNMWTSGASDACKHAVVNLLLAEFDFDGQLLMAEAAKDTFGALLVKMGPDVVFGDMTDTELAKTPWLTRLRGELELECPRGELPTFWLILRECVRRTIQLDCEFASKSIAASFVEWNTIVGIDVRHFTPVAIRALRGFLAAMLRVLNKREFGVIAGRVLVQLNLEAPLTTHSDDTQEEAMIFARLFDVQDQYSKLLAASILGTIGEARNTVEQTSPIKKHTSLSRSGTVSESPRKKGDNDSLSSWDIEDDVDAQEEAAMASLSGLSKKRERDALGTNPFFEEDDDNDELHIAKKFRRSSGSFWGNFAGSEGITFWDPIAPPFLEAGGD